jgi:hypothetical protein
MNRAKMYWLDDEPRIVASKLTQFHQTNEGWSNNPIAQTWIRNQIAYYSPILEAESWESSLSFGGDQGELVKMVIPQARSLARQYIGIACKQKLAVQAVALNNDGSDLNEVIRLGNALGNRIIKDQDLESKKVDLAEKGHLHGAGYIGTFWRTDRGEPFEGDPESGFVAFKGDIEMPILSVFDVFYDYTIECWDDLDWVEIRTKRNRWDLVAQFPELETEIMSLPAVSSQSGTAASQYRSVSDDDMVFCYELYHRVTPAMPEGRMLMYSNDKTIYHDGPNRYGKIPVRQFKPEKVQGTGFGYPMFSNLLPAQEMLDHEFSAIATNHAAFAVQNVTAPRDSNFGVQQINGMNFISFTPVSNAPGGGRPEALQLTQTAPDAYKFIEQLKSHQMELAQVSAALRGSPPPGVTSGAAIATLTTTAIESITPFTEALLTCIEGAIEDAINAYRQFASIERVIEIAGKNQQMTSRKFIGTELDPVKSMKITRINPVMLTSAGRSDLADKLMQAGRVKDIQQYISILEGAPPEKIYSDELSENDLMDAENDMLMDGESPPVLITDDHPKHILSHNKLLNNPRVRMSGENLEQIMSHIEEHVRLEKQKDPFLAAMLRTGKAPQGMPPPQQGAAGPKGQPMPSDMPAGPTAQPAQPADDMLGRQ